MRGLLLFAVISCTDHSSCGFTDHQYKASIVYKDGTSVESCISSFSEAAQAPPIQPDCLKIEAGGNWKVHCNVQKIVIQIAPPAESVTQ